MTRKRNPFISALPALIIFGTFGCGYVASQQEEEPSRTHTLTQPAPTQSKSTEPAPATKPAQPSPKPLADDEIRICGEIFKKTPVTNTIRSEVNRIRDTYAYICDIDWDLFESTNTWGQAWTPSAIVEINEDFEMYRVSTDDTGEDLEFQIRETVRHEFGHQVIFQHFGAPGYDDIEISKIFGNYAPDPLTGEVSDTYSADELAADVVAATLNPDRDDPYVTRYSTEQMNAARYYLDETQRIG